MMTSCSRPPLMDISTAGRSSQGKLGPSANRGQSRSPRIDPERIPRPGTSTGADADHSNLQGTIFDTRQAGKHALPPPSATDYVYAPSLSSMDSGSIPR